MLSLSLVKCCDKSAKCYGHLGVDGGARAHTRSCGFVFCCQNNLNHVTAWRTFLHSALRQEEGGFHHGVDAGKNTIDSDRLFCDFYPTSRLFFFLALYRPLHLPTRICPKWWWRYCKIDDIYPQLFRFSGCSLLAIQLAHHHHPQQVKASRS